MASEPAPPPAGAAAGGGALIAARFFDGRSSQPLPCLLRLLPAAPAGGVALQIHALPLAAPGDSRTSAPVTPLRTFTARQIEWPDAGETRIAVIRFADGSQAQTLEPAALARALRAAGYRAPGLHALAQTMASSWRALLAGVAVCAALSGAVWLYGVPAAARAITAVMPTRWEGELADRTLQTLDASWLSPSKLGAERQAQIRADFSALLGQAGGATPPYTLVFRTLRPRPGQSADGGGGANAFALPGGLLVMTDELVARGEPGALLGVLAHELGHVRHRHATRVAVEGALVGTAVAVISGDITSVAATLPVALATLSFSRRHELEADCFALHTLARAGQSAEPLARLLDTIAGRHREGMADVLSSHPSTAARVQLLRDPAAAAKACGA